MREWPIKDVARATGLTSVALLTECVATHNSDGSRGNLSFITSTGWLEVDARGTSLLAKWRPARLNASRKR